MIGKPRRGARFDVVAIVALGAAALVACWPLGLTNRILAGVDAFTYFTPYWSYRMAAFREGVVPLWNPYLFSGAPFLANIQTATLYPLHWPLSWLSAEQALVWSALLHVWLASSFTYVLARRSFQVTRLAAFAAGLIFGLGGFTLARIENINQLNALAWLPALLWLYDECAKSQANGRKLVSFVGLTLVIALQLLAGHTQTTFINMMGLGLWALASAGRPLTRRWLLGLLPLLAVLPALALSAAQLLPTLELNRLGLRTGGLDFRSAVSFSLRPRLLAQSLLPPFSSDLGNAFGSEGYAEFVGYVGISALALAALGAIVAWRGRGAIVAWRGRGASGQLWLRPAVLSVAGALLALGAYNPLYYVLWRFVPGFDMFRAPARWLELYAMAAALLAAAGLDAVAGPGRIRLGAPRGRWARAVLLAATVAGLGAVAIQQFPAWQTLLAWLVVGAAAVAVIARAPYRRPDRSGRPVGFALVAILFVELVAASRSLPFTAATAPMATGLRNATSALLAAAGDTPAPARDRFLSLSDIRYDPGDLAELRALQADRLTEQAVERLVRTAKQGEVLAPNLPLFFRLPAVDGYDGGLLPLHRYVLLQELFLDPERMTPDGRLAEQLDEIPDGRLLDLTGVRYVITDKRRDLWAGDVYYDLEQPMTLAPGESAEFDLADYPAFAADAVGVVASASAERQAASATIELTGAAGRSFDVRLETALTKADAAQPTVLAISERVTPVALRARNTGETALTVRGLSLIDRASGTHQSITVSPRNDFRRIHSGDVKIYERTGAPGRAWIVHGATPVADETAAAAALADSALNPRATVVVEAQAPATEARAATGNERVETIHYDPERIVYEAQLNADGWLVMADAWYPGWSATVDGAAIDLTRANLLYRAIALPRGQHTIALTYAPASWAAGWKISLAMLAALLLALLAAGRGTIKGGLREFMPKAAVTV